MNTRLVPAVAVTALALGVAACGSSGGSSSKDAAAHGPIKIWYSNNPEEVAWGKAMVAAWNTAHPDREGDRPGDPGRQDLRGGHRRRDHRRQRAVPGLQHLTGRGAAVPEAGRPGRARRHPRRQGVHRGPHRRLGRPVQVAGRQVLPAAVEVQPGDDLLQQGALEEGRRRPRATRRCRPTTSSSRPPARSSRAARAAAIYPAPTSEFFQSWFDFYPLYAARERRQAAGRGRQGDVRLGRGPAGRRTSGSTMYSEGLAAEGDVQRRLVRRRQGRHGDRRPVGDRGLQGQGRLGRRAGARPRPGSPRATSAPSPTRRTIAHVRRVQEPRHRVGRARSSPPARSRTASCCEATGQMPMRAGPDGDLPGVLREEPGLQDVRRPGRAHRRGAQRGRTRSRSGRRSATPTRSR